MTENNRQFKPRPDHSQNTSLHQEQINQNQTTPHTPLKLSSLATAVEVKHWRAWALLLILLTGIGFSSAQLIDKSWSLPITQLLKPSFELNVADMAIQLRLVATSVVASLAGGLLGMVSILLQQLVKNPLASDTTLAIGTGAQLALLLAILFVPSLAMYGGVWIAFVGAFICTKFGYVWGSLDRFRRRFIKLGLGI